jgi:hypothetical protein
MWLEQSDGTVRRLGESLFSLIEDLAGQPPTPLARSGWYRVGSGRKAVLYLRIVGPRARRYPSNSLLLSTKWDDRLDRKGVERENNWFGSAPSADLSVHPADDEQVRAAEEFVRKAFHLYGGQSRSG